MEEGLYLGEEIPELSDRVMDSSKRLCHLLQRGGRGPKCLLQVLAAWRP